MPRQLIQLCIICYFSQSYKISDALAFTRFHFFPPIFETENAEAGRHDKARTKGNGSPNSYIASRQNRRWFKNVTHSCKNCRKPILNVSSWKNGVSTKKTRSWPPK